MTRSLRERFPRAYTHVGILAGTRHMEDLLEYTVEQGIEDESQLDEEKAAEILESYLGAPVTRERFAAAYCPRLVGTFADPRDMPLGWGLPEDEAAELNRVEDEKVRDSLDAIWVRLRAPRDES